MRPFYVDSRSILLASQIELYDMLLGEISGIHTSLARDRRRARFPPPGLNA
jgi:hypothetical protein